jgi:putative intracellular protease/amidase
MAETSLALFRGIAPAERGAAEVVPERRRRRGILYAMQVLFIVTSADTLAPGHPTGVWLEEYAIPYVALSEGGIGVTVASPKGGQGPIDPKTAPNANTPGRWEPALAALAQTKPLSAMAETDFDAVFVPGGHGPMVDLASDPAVARLIGDFVRAGKIVAAVCHGPAALLQVVDADGQSFVKDRKVTGFTNGEEMLAQLQSVVPFLLEDRLRAVGARFEHALAPGGCHVVRDGNLITGENPASSEAIAKTLMEALDERQKAAIGVAPDA